MSAAGKPRGSGWGPQHSGHPRGRELSGGAQAPRGPGLWSFLCEVTALVTQAMDPAPHATAAVAPGAFPGRPRPAAHCSCSVLPPKPQGLTLRAPPSPNRLPEVFPAVPSLTHPCTLTRSHACSHTRVPAPPALGSTLTISHPGAHAPPCSQALARPHTPTGRAGLSSARKVAGGSGATTRRARRGFPWWVQPPRVWAALRALPLPRGPGAADPHPEWRQGGSGGTGCSVLVRWLLNYWLI